MPKVVACKCPNCGAAISVQPVNGIMKCDYCQGTIQIQADDEGGVSLSVKHINVQGGTVQIADNLTVVQGETTVTCSFCGRHNLKHRTFRCWKCKADDLCVEHQSASSICKWCHEEGIVDAKRRRAAELDEADRRREAEIAAENRRRAAQAAEASRRRSKVTLIVLGVVFCMAFLVCCVVPALIGMVAGLAEIPRTGWVIILAVLFGIAVIAGGVGYGIWYYRNMQDDADESEDE